MAGASLLTLLDDIATLLDDVSIMTKVAAKKTAGVLGDDLALNAQQVTGVRAERELPVVWAVAKGSLVNKAILVPAALAISALEAWLRSRGHPIPLVVPLMMVGGAYLCFEGVEKLAHKWLHRGEDTEQAHAEHLRKLADESVDVAAMEKDKIRGAVRTDFILSAEIIVLSLGVVSGRPFEQQILVLIAISLAMTVGVYGLVGGIVKLDDLGLWLTRKGAALAALGRGILRAAPWLMKGLSVVGTLAMFLVGGGILVHNVPALHHFVTGLGPQAGWGASGVSMLGNVVVGVVVGAVVLAVVTGWQKLRGDAGGTLNSPIEKEKGMSRITWLGALALAMGLVAVSSKAAEPATQVRVDGGIVQGQSSDGLLVFKGIPYAAPPVGALRWRAPQPVTAWSGVREARAYGPDCMQRPFATDDAPLTTEPSEDCLYANIWRPEQAKGPLPVLVWVHGGGFVNGGGSPPSYAGAALARQGVLVFSFNYRLGRFGTFAHPQLTRADADQGRLANYGFMDQIAALEWLRRNIAAFGGDPGNVTVIGESAGGMSVHALLTSPLAQGLFQKAVIQSGGEPDGRGALADAEQAGLRFARSLGIEASDPRALDKLRSLPAEKILAGLNLTTMGTAMGPDPTYVFPVADGKVLADLAQAYAAGRFNHVPLMVGATADDIGGADGFMIKGARETADLFARAGLPTWYYRFGYVAEATRAVHPKGAAHASEIPYFFGTVGVRYGGDTRPADQAMSATASGYLLNFVRTGDPNAAGLPAWKPYQAGQGPMQVFGRDGGVTSGP